MRTVPLLFPLFLAFGSNAEKSPQQEAANDGPIALQRHPSREPYGNNLCTVTANMLYANGYFVREITLVEEQELSEYEANLEEYNKLLADFLRGTYVSGGANLNWILGGRMFPRFHHQAMPRRPSVPSFCTGRDTVVHRFSGCAVQNYRVYIGSLYVRQLDDEESRELDEFEYKMREYHQGLIDGFRKASGMWQPNGDYNIPYYHRGWDATNSTSLASSEVDATTADPLLTTTETESLDRITVTDAPAIIYKPKRLKPPMPPKICTQIY